MRVPDDAIGRSVWMRFRGFPLYHQRLVVAVSSDGEAFYVVTPDFDDYWEDVSRSNDDIDAVVWSSPDGSPPDSVPRAQAYRFRAWPDPDRMRQIMERAQRVRPPRGGVAGGLMQLVGNLVGGRRPRAQLPGPIVEYAPPGVGGLHGGGPRAPRLLEATQPGGAGVTLSTSPGAVPGQVVVQVAASPGAGSSGGGDRPNIPMPPAGVPVSGESLGGGFQGSFLAPTQTQPSDEGEKWVAMSTLWIKGEKLSRGTPMQVARETPRTGRYAIQLYQEVHVPCYNLEGDDPAEFKAAEGEYDARVLAVKRNAAGHRHRTWQEVVEQCREVDFPDFPLEGPRTVVWCIEFIGRRHGGPMDHHRWWVSVFNLKPDDPGVAQHELVMKALDLFGCYDQHDVCNTAGLERLMREAQLTEWHYEEKRRTSAASGAASSNDGGGNNEQGGKKKGKRGSPAGPSMEEAAMWTGANKDNQNVMVCPALLKYVSREAESQVNLLKSVRKAREERALAGRDT